MSDESARLSLQLFEVLERVGVSEDMRKIYRDTSITKEIIGTVVSRTDGSSSSEYMVGSSCEGTTTPCMGSDCDRIQCSELAPVIQDIREAPQGVAFLMVTDTHTRPGFVKLQMVHNGTPLTRQNKPCLESADLIYDGKGRVCMKHFVSTLNFIDERSGPADSTTNDPTRVPMDFVSALKCKTFTEIARDSLEKCVTCGWFSRAEVDNMKRLGVLVVGTGHHASDERDIEWRISFSFQERQLMLALNPVQHKCCAILKIIKDIITAGLGVKKVLTSYHCKTCLFNAITDTDRALWTDENLVNCVFICLNKLIYWVSRGYCPNFFIQESNMFERREFVEAQDRLLLYLKNIVDQGHNLFYEIKSDDIGEALRGRAVKQVDERRAQRMYVLLVAMCGDVVECQNFFLQRCYKLQSSELVTIYLHQQLCYLASVDIITEHTQEQTQVAIRMLLPIMHKLYAQQLASVAFSARNHASRHQLLDASTQHLAEGKKCDRVSGNLLEATILYRGGHVESCRDLLEQIERSIHHGAVVSRCRCHNLPIIFNLVLQQRISSGQINLQNVLELAVAPCMMFLPSQLEIIPKALQYEMYRSVGASPQAKEEFHTDWCNWAVVDSKIYLFFMQYLVNSDLNQPIAKQIAVDQIWKKLTDPSDTNLAGSNLGHRETAYNLLGWIYTQEGRIPEALECFRQSWAIRPDHNAARWHLPGLYRRMIGLQ